MVDAPFPDISGLQEHALSAFRSILDGLSDGVTVADGSGRMVFVNRTGRALVGRGLTRENYQAWTEHYGIFRTDGVTPFPPEELPLVRAVRGESGDHTELFLRNPDVPQGRFLSVSHRPWRDADGRILGGIVVYRDVTELRRAQAHKKELVDMIVHDLQNPLAGIQAFLQFLETRAGDGPEGEALEEAIRRCRDLGAMIHNVLVVSRADEGRLAAEIEHVDLAEVARLGVAAFSTAAAVEEHPLRAEAPEPARVPADLDLTRRILENLLRNALRHTPRGTSIVVRARPLGPERGELSVADDGPGIPPEVPPHLFERYGGAELRRRGIRVDPGLGLAFCRAAAEVMGAGISVESDGRRGTEFRLRFPAIRD